MKSSIFTRAGVGLGLLLSVGVRATGAQDTGAPLFEDGRMLRPLVQDVLESSTLVERCEPDPGDPLRMFCLFEETGQTVDVRMNGLLARLQGLQVDPRVEILTFANDVLIQGDPDRIFPERARLRPIVRARSDVERASEEERLPADALFSVPGFPEAVAFAVRDDDKTVHLIRSADDPSLGYADFSQIITRALSNAPWIRQGLVGLACGSSSEPQYCRVTVDQFYESSLVLDAEFTAWLATQVSEPCLIAIPARDEVLIAPLSNRQALVDLEARLKYERPFAITRKTAFWNGSTSAPLEPVQKWSLRGGLLLPARAVVRKENGEVLSFDL
ncbi:MAG: hypothetical protein ACPG40_10670 [Alphaproteobacteria bacterium]